MRLSTSVPTQPRPSFSPFPVHPHPRPFPALRLRKSSRQHTRDAAASRIQMLQFGHPRWRGIVRGRGRAAGQLKPRPYAVAQIRNWVACALRVQRASRPAHLPDSPIPRLSHRQRPFHNEIEGPTGRASSASIEFENQDRTYEGPHG
ncbi:hypothetical protein FKP32DRAFT_1114061 [Trametes sanguinea]|nr:hypothetical protein FKP32DRAFT_1114061 [Trametes sanguinea]